MSGAYITLIFFVGRFRGTVQFNSSLIAAVN